VDPWGTVIAQCSEGPGFALARIDLDYLAEVRKNMPVFNHKRNDLYPAMLTAPQEQAEYEFGQVSYFCFQF